MNLQNYSKPTQTYVTAVTDSIISTYGHMPDEFAINIQILADNVERYYNCVKDLNKRGTSFVKDDSVYINPNYKILKECEDTIFKLSKSFGLDSLAKGRIKVVEKNESAEEVLRALLAD